MSLPAFLRHKGALELELMSTPSAGPLAEALVAFANSDGGAIVMGVNAEGEITGDLLLEDADNALREALNMCSPLVKTEWEQHQDRQGLAVIITVRRSHLLHALTDGRVLGRTRGSNEVLDGARIAQLASSKAVPDFEADIVPAARRADLDDDIIADYLDRRRRRVGRDLRLTDEEVLQGAGALTRDGQVTVAGMLLFGKNPQFFLPQSGVTYIRFPGKDRTSGGREARYLRREEFDGPLAVVIERTSKLLWEELRAEAVVRGMVREDHYLLPQEAVREALVNAVCHREYRGSGLRVEIHRFEDRLEIISPGGLPAYITVENILDEHYSRNPRLVNALYEWHYIEQIGLGVNRMYQEMQLAGYPLPEIKSGNTVIVTLRRGSGIPLVPIPLDPSISRDLNDRQVRALQYLVQNERLAPAKFREMFPSLSSETLRLDLADLIDRGLVVKVGDKKGTYYMLKQR